MEAPFSFDLVTGDTDNTQSAEEQALRSSVDLDALERRVALEGKALAQLRDTICARVVHAPAGTEHRSANAALFSACAARAKSDVDRAYLSHVLCADAGKALLAAAPSDDESGLVRPAQRPPFFSAELVEGLLVLLDAQTEGGASSGHAPQDTDTELAERVLRLSALEDYCLVRGSVCGSLWRHSHWLRVFLCSFAPHPADPAYPGLFDEAEALRAALAAADAQAIEAADPLLPGAVTDAFRAAGTGRPYTQTRAALVQLLARRGDGPRPVPASIVDTRARLCSLVRRVDDVLRRARPAHVTPAEAVKTRVDVLLRDLRTHSTAS